MKYSAFKNKCIRLDANANNFTHFFSYRFADQVAFLCFRTGLSPNQVTGLFFLFGMFSGIMLYVGWGLVAYVFWRLHVILDMADGSLARATGVFSTNAVGFDRSNHIAINSTVLLAPIASSGSIELANFLIISFFLHYFFYRFYSDEKSKTQKLSLTMSFVRHSLGLEGYIAVNVILLCLSLESYSFYIGIIYSLFFMLFFFIKLYRKLKI